MNNNRLISCNFFKFSALFLVNSSLCLYFKYTALNESYLLLMLYKAIIFSLFFIIPFLTISTNLSVS